MYNIMYNYKYTYNVHFDLTCMCQVKAFQVYLAINMMITISHY